ncbi:MFS transporter [Cellulomonas hominis]
MPPARATSPSTSPSCSSSTAPTAPADRTARARHRPHLPARRRPPRTGSHRTTDTSGSAVSAGAPAVAPAPAGIRDTLRVRNYRLYVQSQILTNTGGWAARVAQDWLVLSLTGSAAMVGLTVFFQFLPMIAFGLVGGVVADRYPRRNLLMVTQSIFGLNTLAVGVLALSGHVQAWHVLAAAFISGMATVFDNPARQTFVHEVAGPGHLRQAISLNSAVFQLGGLVGPAVAGALISAVGEGWTFVVNAVACLVAVLLLAVMRTGELTVTPVVARAKGQLREGLAYVRRSPLILWSVVLAGFVSVTGVNMATVLAAYADQVFPTGAGGYALLNSMLAVGALTGALLSTRRRRVRLRQLVLLAAVIGGLQLVAATMVQRTFFVVVLVAMGAATLLYLTGSNTLVQTTVAPHVRGRVMALYVLVLLGAQGVSGLLIGWVSEHAGAHAAMAVGGAGPLLGALAVGTWIIRTEGLKARDVARMVGSTVPRPAR